MKLLYTSLFLNRKYCERYLSILMVVIYKILHKKYFLQKKWIKFFESQNIYVLISNPAIFNISYKYQSKLFILLINRILSSINLASMKNQTFVKLFQNMTKLFQISNRILKDLVFFKLFLNSSQALFVCVCVIYAKTLVIKII